ncbi:AAA family ATPase [Metamycoplasma arthritidis]|uniref:ATP-dependent zinc metalloprotease FtsH n=1 Tax=Metamycoplasma arthritidis (strain 158L3-1) TaxID=243272 RepID=FTSH_META1|nr:ATP-dependent zinc metalloprotease FtsH [Metamycoplasma arthritidis]B3PNH3.1 RecName: Full=ATP-dependent zinc metalloprotease FtsH [Metamycoplasma arthritidis 158L3-1]ACF07575.1 cell division protein FtsH [Metamycoplasma arthritidis 158L3-1]VEU79083.1 AAA family ATPase [Metamycoplasma arthritidis]
MQDQNNSNTPKKKKLSFWGIIGIVASILVLLVIAYIIYYYVSQTTVLKRDFSFLNRAIQEAAKSATDDIYFKSIVDNPYNNSLVATMQLPENVWAALNGMTSTSTRIRVVTFEVHATTSMKNILYNEIISSIGGATPSFSRGLAMILGYSENGVTKAGEFLSTGAPTESIWSTVLRYGTNIIFLLLFAASFIFMFMSFRSQRGTGGLLDNKSVAQRIYSNKKFSDIAGNEEVKEEVKELVDYLKNPKKYSTAGARIPKGILLGGPPGTGKTLIAKATAGEANVPFFFISASNFVEMFVGLGAKRVRDMFEEARKTAPAIIFIDELDAVGRSRGAGIGGGNDEREQTLNQLLVEMDGIKENSGILIMAATNRSDVLDPALLRPGRFDRTITVGLPDIKEREAILKLHAKGKRIANNVSFMMIARRTPGFSGAQLENVINEASLLSVRENTNVITLPQLDEAIDRVMAGPAKKSRTISEKENAAVAYHEAGHAVVGIKIKGGNKVQKITIIPRGHAGGYNLMMPEEEKYNRSKAELIAIITSFMGGRVAEAIIYGKDNVSTGASDDIAKATRIARKMVTEWGLSELGPIKYEEDTDNPFLGRDYMKNASFSAQVGQEIDQEIRKIILAAEANAHKIISENRELLELIKDALIINETIVAEEIEYIAKNMKLPPAITKTKEDLHEEYSDQDFDNLFNEVSGKKIISEDKYVDDLNKEIKQLEEKIEANKSSSKSTVNEEKSKDEKNN